MGQFKPMVKMMTTEPSVELKLKKGGKVAKKAMGGMMGSPMSAAGAMPPAMPARGGMPMAGSPMKPSLAMRRRAMKGLPAGAGPAGPVGGAALMQPAMPMSAPPMKKGGMAHGGESKKTHMAEMSKMKGLAKELKSHENKPASKGHKGLATGGVVNGQGGYKKGGKVMMAKGGVAGDGIINTEGQGGKYRNTMMHTSKPDHAPAKTGGVKLGNGGGYKEGGMTMVEKGGKMVPDFAADGKGKMKKGGMAYATGGVTKSNAGGYKKGGKVKGMMDGGMAGNSMMGNGMMSDGMMDEGMSGYGAYKKGGSTKKAYAAGGTVNSGRPVAMPQGAKKPSSPVSINRFAGTFKKGGKVTPAEGKLMKNFGSENKTAMKQAKAQSNEVYSKYQKMQKGGSPTPDESFFDKNKVDPKSVSDKANRELEEAMNPLGMAKDLGRHIMRSFDPEGYFKGDERKKLFEGEARRATAERMNSDRAAKGQGSVTQTEKSVTVSPAGKKRGGRAC